jgi:hypothetical protein
MGFRELERLFDLSLRMPRSLGYVDTVQHIVGECQHPPSESWRRLCHAIPAEPGTEDGHGQILIAVGVAVAHNDPIVPKFAGQVSAAERH